MHAAFRQSADFDIDLYIYFAQQFSTQSNQIGTCVQHAIQNDDLHFADSLSNAIVFNEVINLLTWSAPTFLKVAQQQFEAAMANSSSYNVQLAASSKTTTTTTVNRFKEIVYINVNKSGEREKTRSALIQCSDMFAHAATRTGSLFFYSMKAIVLFIVLLSIDWIG